MASQQRGLLIAFEGVDRSGKSTQSSFLYERMKAAGEKVELVRFPDRSTSIGKMLGAYLGVEKEFDDHTVHLLFSANRWESSQRILDLLSAGTTVILDRYAHSGVAYTTAKGGLSFEWCCSCDEGLAAPDLIYYLDVPIDVTEKRGNFGAERYEQVAFQRRVKLAYRCVMDISENVMKVDGTEERDLLGQSIWTNFQLLREPLSGQPLGKLWKTKDSNKKKELYFEASRRSL